MKAAYAPYRLIFKAPAGTSRGILLHKDTYFLKVWDESNPEVYGLGECALFKGLSREDTPLYESKLREMCQNIGFGKSTDLSEYSSLQFGLETALCDLSNGGRRVVVDTPFVHGETTIPINGLVWMGSFDEMSARIEEKLSAGFTTIKLKIGAIDFESELELIRQLRGRFSSETLTIRVDANGGFSPEEALPKLNRLAAYGIHSCEQPIKPNQWAEMRKICAESPIHIALDEELIGITDPMQMFMLLREIAPQYLIIKPSLMGGFAGAQEWLKMAKMTNTGAWFTSALESNVGLNAIAQVVAKFNPLIPQGLGTGALYTNNIESPLYQKADYLAYNPEGKWVLPDMQWVTV
ncbi:MAG: o-succinylbenzoate synthase [bacterium]|nr:o-succinylbenzoate synthase [bacterium]MDD6025138.1 o-succinylbenzoate synthase [bacterium]